jgi:hypothetical protein
VAPARLDAPITAMASPTPTAAQCGRAEHHPRTQPGSARAAAITGSERGSSMSIGVASGDSATNGTAGRRPIRSDTGPPMSRPGISAAA